MGHDNGLRMLGLELHDLRYREFLVHMATAIPKQHAAARHRVDVVAQVIVGAKDDLGVGGEAVDDLLGVARGHHTIGERLHGSRGVDIAHHLIAGMLGLESLQVGGLATVGQRAARGEVGAEHRLVGREQLTRLGHEMHATHHHHLGVGLGSLARQSQRIAHKVGNVLYVAGGVVVGQDDGILLLAQFSNLLLQVERAIDRLIYESFLLPALFYHICFRFMPGWFSTPFYYYLSFFILKEKIKEYDDSLWKC